MDMEKVRKFLETKMIRERLHAFGFRQEEIQARLNLLNDDQIHQVALKLDELKVAADGGEAVIIVLLIAAVVLLIIYLLGYRVILKKE